MCQSHEDVQLGRRNVETLLNAQVAGVLVSLARNTQEFHHFDKVRGRGIPLVFFDQIPAGEQANSVVLNDHEGALQATRWSRGASSWPISLGHRTLTSTTAAAGVTSTRWPPSASRPTSP